MARREKKAYKKQAEERVQEERVLKSDSAHEKENNLIKSAFSWTPIIAIFAFGILLYANTYDFGYTLDDKLYITANDYTKKGVDGIKEIWTNDMMTGFFGKKKNLVEGGRYRPLALTTHAIEWEIFEKNASVSHIINILLYGIMGVILLLVLQMILEGESRDRWWWTISIIATALFLAHPTHTEVGANIKSRDEILSLLFALLSFYGVLKYLKTESMAQLVLSGIWFWLSLASKESTVTFLGVVPLTMIFFTKVKLNKAVVAMMPMVLATGAYLALRISILGDEGGSLEVAKELMNKPYLNATDSERLASIFFTMGLYLKLLIWPHPLTHDYYPFHPFATYQELVDGASGYASWSDPLAFISLLLYLALFVFGLVTLIRRLKGHQPNYLGYGVLFYLGTFILFSNLFFDIGAFMNERFLFIPSLGFTIAIAWLLVEKLGAKKGVNLGMAIAAIMLLGYSAKTIDRNGAWRNDYTLASSDVGVSDGSSKIKMTMGSELLDEAKRPENAAKKQSILKEAERYELQSLEIYPGYFPPLDILGNIYFEMEKYDYSVHYFTRALKMKSYDPRMRTNMEAVASMAVKKKQFEAGIAGYNVLSKLLKGKDRARIYNALGEVYGKELGDLENSMKYLKLAKQADPTDASVYQKLGIVYAMTQQRDSALVNFNKSYELDPTNARVLLNLGILYQQMGDVKRGNDYILQAQEMDPSVMKRNE
jgi:tetratricopeptide (TPR) repeat protein